MAIQSLRVFCAYVKPLRLIELQGKAMELLYARLSTYAHDCRIAIGRWVALRVDPFDLACIAHFALLHS
jgi:hypothetical protein